MVYLLLPTAFISNQDLVPPPPPSVLFLPSLGDSISVTMRLPPNPPSAVLSLFVLFLPQLTTGVSIDCENIRAKDTPFNFKALDAVHSLYQVIEHQVTRKTTTFTFNICRPLGRQKGVPSDEDCPNGSRGGSAPWSYLCASKCPKSR